MPRVDLSVSGIAVHRLPVLHHLPDLPLAVRGIQHRPTPVIAEPCNHFFRCNPKVNHLADLLEKLSVFFPQHRSAACRKNCVRVRIALLLCNLQKQIRLHPAKALLTLRPENLGYRHVCLLFDQSIHLEPPEAVFSLEAAAHGRFSASHVSNYNYISSHGLKLLLEHIHCLVEFFIRNAHPGPQREGFRSLPDKHRKTVQRVTSGFPHAP